MVLSGMTQTGESTMVASMEFNTFHASKKSILWFTKVVDDDKMYFSSEPLSGSMIRPEKVRNFETVREAIENRYILTPIEDDFDFNDFQMVIGAPLMEFVGVEKTWQKQR